MKSSRVFFNDAKLKIEIISVVLDWMSHKDYDKMNKRKN